MAKRRVGSDIGFTIFGSVTRGAFGAGVAAGKGLWTSIGLADIVGIEIAGSGVEAILDVVCTNTGGVWIWGKLGAATVAYAVSLKSAQRMFGEQGVWMGGGSRVGILRGWKGGW